MQNDYNRNNIETAEFRAFLEKNDFFNQLPCTKKTKTLRKIKILSRRLCKSDFNRYLLSSIARGDRADSVKNNKNLT